MRVRRAAIALVETANISDHMSAVRDVFVEKAGYEPVLQPYKRAAEPIFNPFFSANNNSQ